MLEWLLGAGFGPAAVALPVNWAADALAGCGKRWFQRFRRTDDLSRLVRAATGATVGLTRAEFEDVRRLLEDQQTWSLLGQGTVEDLARRIVSCLPPRDGRTAEDSLAAAMVIARGLLESAVADLEPELFQRLLLARLHRMETGQASALDKALLDLHADLVARFAGVMEQFRQVLDRLPRGPAERGEIVVYLKTLIDWLNADPWPQDQRFRGSVLTPAAVERKLRIAAGVAAEQDFDADELATRCRRLVILGGSGSGKTWLAKRTARRCAERALQAMAAGGTPDEVELPLYTTCSHLLSARGVIRVAAVSSALDQLADLGGSRLSAAIQDFFTERKEAPTLLVIDSLDEAHGSDERLRQADTLPWRIVLTSRPGSWNHQLTIEEGNDSHRVGNLQPLRYPNDVEPFIERWFSERPRWGKDLAGQLAQRPGLQQSATVPLILAFYCIVGGGQPLPDFRCDLHTRVLRRMLTGRWRGGGGDRDVDAGTCLETLRAWAWSGAINHPVSEVGAWDDDIPTGPGRLDKADRDALDHVATPSGLPDVDSGKTLRRFIHRSIREHLVAEHIAGLPVDEAVGVLLPHLWYDPDWEYAAPAAIAAHPHHDRLLRELICRAASSDQIPADLSVIDAGWAFRALLARVASESSEADWSPEVADTIGRARVELVLSGRTSNLDVLGGAAHWGTSNGDAREVLLRLLYDQIDDQVVEVLVRGVVLLAPAAQDRQQACAALNVLLSAGHILSGIPRRLAEGVAQLGPTAEDKGQARMSLLRFLDYETDIYETAQLVAGVAQLATTSEDKRQARETLLAVLRDRTDARLVAQQLTDELVRLDPTAEDKLQARDGLLGMMTHQAGASAAAALVAGMVRLDPTADDKRQARHALLGMLVHETDSYLAETLAGGLARLDPTADDKRQARHALLGMLVHETDSNATAHLAAGVIQLATTAEDKREARRALLALLASQTGSSTAEELAAGVAKLDPTAEDKREARRALLGLLARETSASSAAGLVAGLARLDPTADDKRQARKTLLRTLAHETDDWWAAQLGDAVARLEPTAEDKQQARQALLGLLACQTSSRAEELVRSLVRLDPAAEDKQQARQALLAKLASRATSQLSGYAANRLVDGVVQLTTAAEDKQQARQALLALLASQISEMVAAELARGLARLDPTVRDLDTWHGWAVAPTVELLAAVRRNSALAAWLPALPSLASLSG